MTINISSRAYIEYNPIIGYLYIPNLDVRVLHENGGYFIKTNNMGFRSDYDFHVEKKEGIKRILFFGDSFTAGDGVKNFDRYTDIIGRSLDGVEIFNFGLTSSGTDQQYLIYKEFGSKMNADLVVIAPMIENIRRNVIDSMPAITHDGMSFSRPKPFFKIKGTDLVLHNVPVPKVDIFGGSQKNMSEKYISTFINKLRNINKKYKIKNKLARLLRLKIELYKEYQSSASYPWQLMKKIIFHWTKEINVAVLIVPIPWHLHYEEDYMYTAENYRNRFAELEANNLIMVHDPLNFFTNFKYNQKKEFTFFNDKHLTQKGHIALAESILPVVTKMLKGIKNE